MNVCPGGKRKEKILRMAAAFAALLALAAFMSAGLEMRSMAAGEALGYITLNKKSITMEAGSRATLKIKSARPKGAAKKVTWKSSNKKVAAVNSKGIVRAKNAGTAVIAAKAVKGAAKAKCVVKVVNDSKKDASGNKGP